MVNARTKSAKNAETTEAPAEKKERAPRVVRSREQKFNDEFKNINKRLEAKNKQLEPLKEKLDNVSKDVLSLKNEREVLVANAAIYGIELVVEGEEATSEPESAPEGVFTDDEVEGSHEYNAEPAEVDETV